MSPTTELIVEFLLLAFLGAVAWAFLKRVGTPIRWFSRIIERSNGNQQQLSHDFIHHVVSSSLSLSWKLHLLKNYCESIVYGLPRKSDLDGEFRLLLVANERITTVPPNSGRFQSSERSLDDVNDILATSWDQEFKCFALKEYCKYVLRLSSSEYQDDSCFGELFDDTPGVDIVKAQGGGNIVNERQSGLNLLEYSEGTSYGDFSRSLWDLHGYKLVDAINLVKKVLATNDRGSGRVVKFVTGRGRHSVDNIPVIKMCVRKLLRDEGYKHWWYKHDGMVAVKM